MKDIKELLILLNKRRSIPCSWIGRLNVIKRSVLPNLIYRFNTTPIKIPASFFRDINKLILEFIWRDKRPRISNSILKEKNKFGGLEFPGGTVAKTPHSQCRGPRVSAWLGNNKTLPAKTKSSYATTKEFVSKESVCQNLKKKKIPPAINRRPHMPQEGMKILSAAAKTQPNKNKYFLKIGGLTLSDFKTYYKGIVIKIAW